MRRQSGLIALTIGLAFGGCMFASSVLAAKNFTEDEAQVANKLQKAYGVKILRIRPGQIDGKPVYIVTVMNPAGNSNAAFQVTTLAVDKNSGELVSQYRQTPTGQRHSGANSYNTPDDASGMIIRQRTEQRLRER